MNGTLGSSNLAFVANSGSSPPATTTTAGVIEIATQAEVNARAAANLAVTPETLGAADFIVRRFVTAIGDGSQTSFVVTHNLNNQRPQVAVSLTASPFDQVWCEIEFTSVNALTVRTNTAPAAGAYTVSVQG